MHPSAKAPLRLLVVVTPNFNLAATAGFIDPFRAANYLEGKPLYRWRVASAEGGDCVASNGMRLATAPLSEVTDEAFDMVVVSSSWAPEMHSSEHLHAALWRWARRGATLGALDTGAFILAGAGLLDGRRATVHYEHIDALAELFTGVDASEDMVVFDGNRITCSGGSAAADFALHVIRAAHGDTLANAAARYVFHQSLRPPGTPQDPGPVEPLGKTVSGAVRRAIRIMERNLEEPLPIPAICTGAGVSQRQLDRLFARYVGKTPALYYRDIRLDRARGLVTQTDLPLSQVAVASGFASQAHFSRAYRERFGLPPRRDRVEGRVPFEFRPWPMHRQTS